ncbi:hypothetical protein [Haloarchaeobius sp. HRN-SO-5]|uniref:hypothetical protein n=1 Tax=Haloarchaeobius sp. HRN-SO-5 TaxID=3446118 RepID=UPI003EBD1EAC
MSEPAWAQVLTIFYEKGDSIEVPIDVADIPEDHILISETTLDSGEVVQAYNFLEEQGLVKRDWEPESQKGEDVFEARTVSLKPEGFSVAHDREHALESQKNSSAVALLTGVLAWTALVQVLIAWTASNLTGMDEVVIGGIIMITTILLAYSWYRIGVTGAFDI